MSKLRLLDLFCGAGGAAMGYHRAGFEVVGVDVKPQPHYPFEFHEADAMTYPVGGFDAIHASPPCQAFSVLSALWPDRRHPDLLTPTRQRLLGQSAPWVIENVPGAPMRPDVILCGSHFQLIVAEGYLRRHRWFETSWRELALPPPCQHWGAVIGVYGHGRHGGGTGSVALQRRVMGIDWMNRDELAQSIPPAYTEWIGAQLMSMIGIGGGSAKLV